MDKGGFFPGWRLGSLLDQLEEDQELMEVQPFPAIPVPQTPREPMEFLSRSWGLSDSEVSKALAQKQKQSSLVAADNGPVMFPEIVATRPPMPPAKLRDSTHKRTGSIGKWFHPHHYNKESNSATGKKKDKARIDTAHVHTAVSIAGLASGLTAIAAAGNSSGSSSKMTMALASATELLASYCVELAEQAGADHDRLASVVKSAVDIQSPGDLMTLTAAAATALRGEAALRSRMPKDARKNATISPYDRGMAEGNFGSSFAEHLEDNRTPFVGKLMQYTRKGVLRWKRVSVCIDKKSQVIVKIKSKRVGGALSKKHKCVVYGVCDEKVAWPYKTGRDNTEEVTFGLKTAQGLLEFKCKNKVHKQKWVDEIQNQLRGVNTVETTGHSMERFSISNNSLYYVDVFVSKNHLA